MADTIPILLAKKLNLKTHGVPRCRHHSDVSFTSFRRPRILGSVLVAFLSLLYFPDHRLQVEAANYDDYYKKSDDQSSNDDAYVAAAADDANSAADDQYAVASASATDDAVVTDDKYSSSAYQKEQQQYQNTDDDTFHWNSNIGFDGVSVMPLSCIN